MIGVPIVMVMASHMMVVNGDGVGGDNSDSDGCDVRTYW